MGTKSNPGAFDCYANAAPDEPMFVLLARDKAAPDIVEAWARGREWQINSGRKPESDRPMVAEALECAEAMRVWRHANWKPGTASAATSGPLVESTLLPPDLEADIRADERNRVADVLDEVAGRPDTAPDCAETMRGIAGVLRTDRDELVTIALTEMVDEIRADLGVRDADRA